MPGSWFARRMLLPLLLSGLFATGAIADPPASEPPGAGPMPVTPAPAAPTTALPPAIVPSGPVEVYRPDGSRQCEEGSGVPREAMAAELTAAGVRVLDSRTGTDGLMRIAVCGAPTGTIHIFRIEAAGLATAEALGFRPLAGWAP